VHQCAVSFLFNCMLINTVESLWIFQGFAGDGGVGLLLGILFLSFIIGTIIRWPAKRMQKKRILLDRLR